MFAVRGQSAVMVPAVLRLGRVSASPGGLGPRLRPPTPSPRATPAGLCGTLRSPEVTLPLGGDEVLRTSDLGLPGAGRAAPHGLSPTGSLGP